MKVTESDINKLQKAVYDGNLSFVKEFVKQFGTFSLFQEYYKYGQQSLYPDMYRYYLIHIAIDNHDQKMLAYFKEVNFSPMVSYSIDTNFNSRADQFLNHETIDLITYAQNRKCSKNTIQFIINWIHEYTNI